MELFNFIEILKQMWSTFGGAICWKYKLVMWNFICKVKASNMKEEQDSFGAHNFLTMMSSEQSAIFEYLCNMKDYPSFTLDLANICLVSTGNSILLQ